MFSIHPFDIMQHRENPRDSDPTVNWKSPASLTATPDKMELQALEEFYRGHFNDLSHVHCFEHFDQEGAHPRITHNGCVTKKNDTRSYQRMKCIYYDEMGEEKNHSFSIMKLWYQMAPSVKIPNELMRAYHYVSTAPAYKAPKGVYICARPLVRRIYDQNAMDQEAYAAAKEAREAQEAVLSVPLSPRGVSYFEEGLRSAKHIDKKGRMSFTPRTPSDRRAVVHEESSETDVGHHEESIEYFNQHVEEEYENESAAQSSEDWKSPKKVAAPAQGLTTPPVRILTSNVNRFKALEDPTEALVAAIADEVEARLMSSPIFAQLSPKPTQVRVNRREEEATKQTQPVRDRNSFAGAAALPEGAPLPKGQPQGRRIVMTEEYKRMIYAGQDPRKKRLFEIYIGGLRRTFKSNIRQALRADNIPTQHIADIQFIGKNVTLLIVPVDRVEEVLAPLRVVKHFKVLEKFDPLDIGYMKTLPQYAAKSDIELVTLARGQATARIQRYIDGLPENRKGMKKYYTIKKRNLESAETFMDADAEESEVSRPRNVMISDFITAELEKNAESIDQ